MKLLIDLSESLYEEIINDEACGLNELGWAIARGKKMTDDLHLKGYLFDSLVYRYKNAREKVALYEKLLHKEGTPKRDYEANADRDIWRFIEILNEAMGEHD